jgi:RNA polymerase sporulation-specific sigma factor
MEQNNYEEPEINLNDRLFDYRDNFEEKIEDRAAVDCIIESFELLNEVERKIIEKRVLSGEKTQRELAILLNLSQSYVSRIERKTLLKIRKYLIRRGIDVNLNQTKVRRINEKAKNIYHN